MTTLYSSKRSATIHFGLVVLVSAAITALTFVRGSTGLGLVLLLVTIGLAVLTVVLHRIPPNELRVSSDLIELARPSKSMGSLSRADTDGRIDVIFHGNEGQTFWSLVPAGGRPASGFPVDDFSHDEIRAAAEQHGWIVNIVE